MKKILIFLAALLVVSNTALSQSGDAALKAVTEKDRSSRSADGRLTTLSATEHLARGRVYFDNRQYPQAREHFQKILDNYPHDDAMSGALFMTGRSYYWERNYTACIPWLERVSREYPATKDGREGLYFDASCSLRIARNDDAARLWIQYTVMYPQGERVENAYVNSIDALRAAGKYKEADEWVEKTRTKFPGTPTEANALFARLRMEIFREQWRDAEATAALMQAQARFDGSFTSLDEVKFLRAVALDKQGKLSDAKAMYLSTSPFITSYWGELARDRTSTPLFRPLKPTMEAFIGLSGPSDGFRAADFPAAYRSEILAAARPRHIDPRFVLAIMRQESTFNPTVKSPAAARGLMQLTIDTAHKYGAAAGYPHASPDDLYNPKINIALGCEEIADHQRQFGTFYEAIAASYNGGDDNVTRWLANTKPKEPGIFTSEVGFSETKAYVLKVMTNYRIYKNLYDEDLNRR